MKDNNVNIECIGVGGYSSVLRVGDYVVKLGDERDTYEIPESDLWAQPLLREEIRNEEGKAVFMIEIFRPLELMPDTIENREIADRLRRMARKEGWRWGDCKVRNIGFLKEGDYNVRVIPLVPREYGGFIKREEEQTVAMPQENAVRNELEFIGRARILDLDKAYIKDPYQGKEGTDR